jgi:uncharacterized protein YxjI
MTPLLLAGHSKLTVKQSHELAEWIGFETRNKYRVLDEQERPVAYAAEQQKGILGFLLRQYLGHWRGFEIHFFTPERGKALVARQPFRFLFQRLEVSDAGGRPIGALQQRFSILKKRFDVQDPAGNVILKMSSPLLRIWTFPFLRAGKQVALIRKKWAGILAEALTDKDTFQVEYDPALTEDERSLVLAASVFIDLRYFEHKA